MTRQHRDLILLPAVGRRERRPSPLSETEASDLHSGDGGNRTRVRDRAEGGFYERIRRSDLVPGLASPAGLPGTSPLELSPVRRGPTSPGEPASDPGDPRGRQAGAKTSAAS